MCDLQSTGSTAWEMVPKFLAGLQAPPRTGVFLWSQKQGGQMEAVHYFWVVEGEEPLADPRHLAAAEKAKALSGGRSVGRVEFSSILARVRSLTCMKPSVLGAILHDLGFETGRTDDGTTRAIEYMVAAGTRFMILVTCMSFVLTRFKCFC